MVMSPRRAAKGWRRAMVLVAAACLLGGCQPANRLDRVVQARTFAELQSWLADTKRGAGSSLSREIDVVFMNLAANTPRYKRPVTEHELHQSGNPLCLRVHGRRLRDVMIDSYTTLNDSLERANNLDAENLVRLSGVVDIGKAEAFEERIAFVKQKIAERDETIRQGRMRILQLQSPDT